LDSPSINALSNPLIEIGIAWIFCKSSILTLILHLPNYPSFPDLLNNSFYSLIGKSNLTALVVSFLGTIFVDGGYGLLLVINCVICVPVWVFTSDG
jgi:hypothetical protein